VTHECDYPPSVLGKPVVIKNAILRNTLSPQEIDQTVSDRLRAGSSLYAIQEDKLRQLKPDLVLTQDLCQVCAPSGQELHHVLSSLHPKPTVLSLSPHTLEDINDNFRSIARATGTIDRGERLIAEGHARLEKVRSRTTALDPVSVFCMEWVEPVYCSGHWVPEMLAIAGGKDPVARPGARSVKVGWENVVGWDPDVLLIMPCGYDLRAAYEQIAHLTQHSDWAQLTAVRRNQVYAVDANAYFARPGPRVVDGIELLAHLLHPRLFSWQGSKAAFARWA
jgi:iron complex transport system substrate-binding protein